MASISPKHDTHPLVLASGRFSVSLLAADQVEQGQYFSYPGRRFRYVGRSRSLAIYRADPSLHRWRSVVHQLAQLPWFAWNVTKKVLISAKILRHAEWPY